MKEVEVTFTEPMIEVINRAASRRPNDIDRAVEEAHRKIRNMPEYSEWIDRLVLGGIRAMVQDSRHQSNREIKRLAGDYDNSAKVVVGKSRSTNQAAADYYALCYAGKRLGDMVGDEVEAAAQGCLARSNGELANYRFLSSVVALVSGGRRVRDCVSNRKLGKLWREANDFVQTSKRRSGRRRRAKKALTT